jgi:hypothetical protein
VKLLREKIVFRSGLNDLTEVHNGDIVAYVPHDTEVVGYKHIGQIFLILQIQ